MHSKHSNVPFLPIYSLLHFCLFLKDLTCTTLFTIGGVVLAYPSADHSSFPQRPS